MLGVPAGMYQRPITEYSIQDQQ